MNGPKIALILVAVVLVSLLVWWLNQDIRPTVIKPNKTSNAPQTYATETPSISPTAQRVFPQSPTYQAKDVISSIRINSDQKTEDDQANEENNLAVVESTLVPSNDEGVAANKPVANITSANQLLTNDEIKELGGENSGAVDSSLKALGLRQALTELSDNSVESVKTITPSPSPTPLELLVSKPKGFASLALMHPGASTILDTQLTAIKDSNSKNIFLGVLTDGTFGTNFDLLAKIVKSLHQDSRILTLVLYLTNGASQRNFETTDIDAPFVKTDPIIFREQIIHDATTRAKFRSLVQANIPIIKLLKSLDPNHQAIMIPMLEDNLVVSSYAAMRQIILEELGPNVIIMRNPCLGCFPGNDADSLGDGRESHDPSELSQLGPKDGLTLDGVGFLYPNEVADPLVLDAAGVESLALAAQGLRYFGLWRADWQGNSPSGATLAPDNRFYHPIPKNNLAFVTELLSVPVEE